VNSTMHLSVKRNIATSNHATAFDGSAGQSPWQQLKHQLAKCETTHLNQETLVIGNLQKNKWANVSHETGSSTINEILHKFWGDALVALIDCSGTYLFPMPCSGIRLYYHEGPGVTHICTNLSELIETVGEERKPHLAYAIAHIVGPFEISPFTPFESYKKVPNGHAIRFDAEGNVTLVRIWPAFGAIQPLSEDDFVTCFLEIVHDYLSEAAGSARSLNFFLSGGFDSTLLAYCTRKLLGPSVDMNVINCYDSRYSSSDEREAVQQTVDALGATVTYVDLASMRPFSRLLDLSTQWGDFTGKIALAEYYESINMSIDGNILSGQGGDTLFFEFPRLTALAQLPMRDALLKSVQVAHCYGRPILNILAGLGREFLTRKLDIQPRQFKDSALEAYFHPRALHLRDHLVYQNTISSYKGLNVAQQAYIQEVEFTIEMMAANNSGHCSYERSPYLSRPALEAFLALPLASHFGPEKRPIQRRLLREVCGNDYKPRFTKGYITPTMHAGMVEQRTVISTLLNEGVLADHTSKGMLQDLWRNLVAGHGRNLQLIGKLVEVEGFYRSWEGVGDKQKFGALNVADPILAS